jgi:hypothetical protein
MPTPDEALARGVGVAPIRWGHPARRIPWKVLAAVSGLKRDIVEKP